MREAGKGAGASLRGKKGTFYIIRKVECPLSFSFRSVPFVLRVSIP